MNQDPEFNDILSAMARTLEPGLDADQAQQPMPRTWSELQQLAQTPEAPRRAMRRQQWADRKAAKASIGVHTKAGR